MYESSMKQNVFASASGVFKFRNLFKKLGMLHDNPYFHCFFNSYKANSFIINSESLRTWMDCITEYTFLSLYSIQAFCRQSVIFRGEFMDMCDWWYNAYASHKCSWCSIESLPHPYWTLTVQPFNSLFLLATLLPHQGDFITESSEPSD